MYVGKNTNAHFEENRDPRWRKGTYASHLGHMKKFWNDSESKSNHIWCLRMSYYGASEASVVFRRLTEISEYAGRGHAFHRLISQQPLDRFTCGNFCSVASSLLPTCGQ